MMRVEDITTQVVLIFLSLILLCIAFYLGLTRLDTYLRYKAIDGCAAHARFERKDNTGIVSYPIEDFYNNCLEKKGI